MRGPVLYLICSIGVTAQPSGLASYDSQVRPSTANCTSSPPDHVHVAIAIERLVSIDQVAKEYELDGYFRAFWTDQRLAQPSGSCGDEVVLPGLQMNGKKLWDPGFYVNNAEKIGLGGSTEGESVFIAPDGGISWSRRMRLTLSCPSFRYGQLPWDVQYCDISIGLYRYISTQVTLSWTQAQSYHGIDVINPERLEVGEWSMSVVSIHESQRSYASGTYQYARACFKLKRNSLFFLIQMGISLLLVVATYSGLYVSPEAAPGRIALAFLCFLMVLNNFNSVMGRLPSLSNGRRVWVLDFIGGTMIFNFILLLEYSVVNFMATLKKKKAEHEAKFEATVRHIFDTFDEEKTGALNKKDMFAMCHALQLDMTKHEIDGLLAECDVSGDNQIEYGEFLAALKNHEDGDGRSLQSIFEEKKDLITKITGKDFSRENSKVNRDHASEVHQASTTEASSTTQPDAAKTQETTPIATEQPQAAPPRRPMLARQKSRVKASKTKMSNRIYFWFLRFVNDAKFRMWFPVAYIIFLACILIAWFFYDRLDDCVYA